VEFAPNAYWLGSVLATLPGFVLVVDRDGVIRYINRVEPGYVISEVVGMKSEDFLFPDSMARLQIVGLPRRCWLGSRASYPSVLGATGSGIEAGHGAASSRTSRRPRIPTSHTGSAPTARVE
jgi:hypothetical protein